MPKLEYVELTVAANRLDMSERTIRRRIQEGHLQGGKRGGKWWVQVPAEIDLPSLTERSLLPGTDAVSPKSLGEVVSNLGSQVAPVDQTFHPISTDTQQPGRSDSFQTEQRPPASRERSPAFSSSPSNGGNKQRERTWTRGHREYTPASGDLLDQTFAVGRIAAWGKLRELRTVLQAEQDRADGDAAAAMLLEGYLAYGTHKVECYRKCRSILCRLATRLEADDADEEHFMAASDTLGAVHALVVTMCRNSEEGKYGKSRDRSTSGQNNGNRAPN